MSIAPTLRTTGSTLLRRTFVTHHSGANTFTARHPSTARTVITSPAAIARSRSTARQLHGSARTMSGDPSAPAAAETDAVAAQNAAELAITPESISKSLEEKIGATYCAVEDMSGGCGQAFEAMIVSPQFEKKTTLARHRLVNSALRQEIAAIHAWTPKCFTPDEWAKKQGGA